jgi:hypothetical protein
MQYLWWKRIYVMSNIPITRPYDFGISWANGIDSSRINY